MARVYFHTHRLLRRDCRNIIEGERTVHQKNGDSLLPHTPPVKKKLPQHHRERSTKKMAIVYFPHTPPVKKRLPQPHRERERSIKKMAIIYFHTHRLLRRYCTKIKKLKSKLKIKLKSTLKYNKNKIDIEIELTNLKSKLT